MPGGIDSLLCTNTLVFVFRRSGHVVTSADRKHRVRFNLCTNPYHVASAGKVLDIAVGIVEGGVVVALDLAQTHCAVICVLIVSADYTYAKVECRTNVEPCGGLDIVLIIALR